MTAVAPEGPHLLVVDDDDRIRDLLKTFLQRHGYRVTGARDAAGARRLVEVLRFDLLGGAWRAGSAPPTGPP